MRTVLTILFLFFSFSLWAQDTTTLNAEQYLQMVKQFHPVVRQSGIAVEKAGAGITSARAAFDPILSHYITNKTFDGTNYYRYSSPEINIPTWYGITLYSGLENLNGSRYDPTQTAGKTSYAGISLPLAKNLVMDKRRAFLKQAKIFRNMAETEQRQFINDLLLEAMEAYWNWVKAYETWKIVKTNAAINIVRFELVRKSFINGERAAIDTAEAATQLLGFQYEENRRRLEFTNAGLELSAYLWTQNNEPLNLPLNIIPQEGWENEANINRFNLSLNELLSLAEKHHPALRIYDSRLDILKIERKLKFQELLPKVDFHYNFLSKGYTVPKGAFTAPFFENNYQYGLKLGIPLRLSEGRGAYRLAKLKIEETRLLQNMKEVEIQVKIKSYFNEWTNLKNQVALQSRNYEYCRQLLQAEETRFFNGESSLFLINSRENKVLEVLEKLVDLKTKYFKTLYSIQWSAGLLQ
ncbi:MAG: TolC family protein [Ferruginibacter sp.]